MKLIEAVRTHRIMAVPRKIPDGTSPIHGSNDKWLDFHGEQFRMAFDEAFGLLYIDLKILSGAVEWT